MYCIVMVTCHSSSQVLVIFHFIEVEPVLALVPQMAHRVVQIIQYGISNGPVDQSALTYH